MPLKMKVEEGEGVGETGMSSWLQGKEIPSERKRLVKWNMGLNYLMNDPLEQD